MQHPMIISFSKAAKPRYKTNEKSQDMKQMKKQNFIFQKYQAMKWSCFNFIYTTYIMLNYYWYFYRFFFCFCFYIGRILYPPSPNLGYLKVFIWPWLWETGVPIIVLILIAKHLMVCIVSIHISHVSIVLWGRECRWHSYFTDKVES